MTAKPVEERDRLRDFARVGAEWAWRVDAQLNIVELSEGATAALGQLPFLLVGSPLHTLGRLLDGPGGEPPIMRARREASPFHGQLVEAGGGLQRLDGVPLFEGSRFVGFQGLGRAAAAPADELTSERFVAAMSHELRTPLTAIIGFAEAMALGTQGPLPAHYEDYARDIASAGRHLMSMLDDLLDIAPETETPRLERARFDLVDVVDQARSMVALRAAARHIALDVSVERKVSAAADRRRTLQILVNLLTNAVKFTPEGGQVRVRVERRRTSVRVLVDDNGSGILPKDRERIVDKFARGDGVEAEGSGLGLHISRELARQMGGDLQLEAAPTGGARFVLTLPSG